MLLAVYEFDRQITVRFTNRLTALREIKHSGSDVTVAPT